MASGERLLEVYRRLLSAYGPQNWWPADDPLEVIVGAILTQHAAWTNVERAIRALRDAGLLSLKAMCDASIERIAELIRPAVYYNAKARRLKAFVASVSEHSRGELTRFLDRPMETVRTELLSIYGIGPETADAILLYAANKPSFVVDAYTRRLLERLGWVAVHESYDAIRSRFVTGLPRDPQLYNEYHALIVQHGKQHCRGAPVCGGCPLASLCPHPSVETPRSIGRSGR